MKIGIVTLTEGFNYGCKLQNYALLRVINKHFPNDTIVTVDNDTCCGNNHLSRMKRLIKLGLKNPIHLISDFRKQLAFKSFNKKYLCFSDEVMTNQNISTSFADIDTWVCGSDQIWNPYYIPNIEINTAYFASNSSKKISYAASIGVNEIPELRMAEYRKCVGQLDSISVRENEAANLLKNLVDRDVQVVVDPTLLLDRSEWAAFEEKPNDLPTKYILTYFLKGMSENTRKEISRYAEQNKLEIVELNDYRVRKWFAITPTQFVYLVDHCEVFVTDSFHGTIFSLIFNKSFYVLDRNSNESIQKQSGRIMTLLKLVGLENRFVDVLSLDNKNEICYESVSDAICTARQESMNFLIEAISRKNNVAGCRDELCASCGACINVCPVGAISYKKNKMGFLYPFVENEKCISCGLCKNVCLYNNKYCANTIEGKKAYRAENKNDEVRIKSSSGGVFSLLAKDIIEEGGVVFAPTFNADYSVSHKLISSVDELFSAVGSKYVQSECFGAFKLCKKMLESERKVLFSGTPCQNVGLKNYLGKEYTNLYTQDIICHGCSSEKLLKKYISEIEEKHGKKVIDFKYRSKITGWKKYSIQIFFDDGTSIDEVANQNHYFLLFLRNYGLRESCYRCKCRIDKRVSDITLGDYWGTSENDDKGTSLIIVNSKKGESLLESIKLKKRFGVFEEVEINDAISMNKSYSEDVAKPDNLSTFYSDFSMPIDYLYKRYINRSILKKVICKLRTLK